MHGEILSTAVQEAGTALCTRHTQTKTDRQTERDREMVEGMRVRMQLAYNLQDTHTVAWQCC